jgi:type II secretory ATPase GspE/PulE/Tfp pilus assembly ATPase PilB-like protein
MEQAKQKLIEQLATKEDEVLALQTLQTRNQQLEKRVAEKKPLNPKLVVCQFYTETTYAARTNNAFVLTETATVAELIYQGATENDIRRDARSFERGCF